MLTKSDYLNYIQCPKKLWLYKKRKDLIPEIDANTQKLFTIESFEELKNHSNFQVMKVGVHYFSCLFGESYFLAICVDVKRGTGKGIKITLPKSVVFLPTIELRDFFELRDFGVHLTKPPFVLGF